MGKELNICLAKFLGLQHIGTSVFGKDEIRVRKPMEPSFRVDYCNNWNDLMPLVVEYKICLIRTNEYGDKWCADPNMDDFDSVRVVLKDAKRALAECLLQVLIAKGERS